MLAIGDQVSWRSFRRPSYGGPWAGASQRHVPFGRLSASEGRYSSWHATSPAGWVSVTPSFDTLRGRLHSVWQRRRRPPSECECWVADGYLCFLHRAWLKRKSDVCRRSPCVIAAGFG